MSGCVLFISAILMLTESSPFVVMVLTFIGKFTVTMSYSLTYLFTAELYPTTIRSFGFAMCAGIARIFNCGLPFIVNGNVL